MCVLKYQCLADICLVSIDRRWICFPWRIEHLILQTPQKTYLCYGEPVGICKCLSSSGHSSNNSIGPREVIVVSLEKFFRQIRSSYLGYTDIRVVPVPMTVFVYLTKLLSYTLSPWFLAFGHVGRPQPISSGSWEVSG